MKLKRIAKRMQVFIGLGFLSACFDNDAIKFYSFAMKLTTCVNTRYFSEIVLTIGRKTLRNSNVRLDWKANARIQITKFKYIFVLGTTQSVAYVSATIFAESKRVLAIEFRQKAYIDREYSRLSSRMLFSKKLDMLEDCRHMKKNSKAI